MIILKSERELNYMRDAGRVVAQTHQELGKALRPGITTKELDQISEEFILSRGAHPSFKGYNGFPGSICSSINEVVVHGIPGLRKVEIGDIISIDVGAIINGYHGDAAKTLAVGEISQTAADLLRVTEESLYRGIEQAIVNNRLSDVSHAIQSYVEERNFSVIRDFCGHGIGNHLHEDPQVPNFGVPGRGPRLKPGLCLAIEPMVNVGSHNVTVLEDKWTTVTDDQQLSAHFEHTIAVTEDGPLILTEL